MNAVEQERAYLIDQLNRLSPLLNPENIGNLMVEYSDTDKMSLLAFLDTQEGVDMYDDICYHIADGMSQAIDAVTQRLIKLSTAN